MNLRFGLAVFLFLFLGSIYAAVDPVSWSLSPTSGFPSVRPGEASTVTYTLTVNPQFPGAVRLHTKFVESSQSFTIVDGCNNHSFNPGASCTIVITFTPPDTMKATIQMSYQYNSNVIPVPQLTASGSAHNQGIIGSISGLPTSISLSPEQQPTFTVTYLNNSSADIIGYAGNTEGANLLTTAPTSRATVTVVPDQNFCGTASAPVVIKGGHSCTIQGKITPVSTGAIVVSGLFTYNNKTDTSTPSQPTTIISSGSCFSAEATLPFQNPTLTYADNVLQFTYSNSCATPQALGPVTFSSSGTSSSPTILGPPDSDANVAYDHCSNQTIPGYSSCTVLVPVLPQNTGTLEVTASATASSVPVTATSSTTVNAPAYNHSVTFVNQCPFPVWYGITSPGDPTASPSPSAYLLPKQVVNQAPSAKKITFRTAYNGVMVPRTGCTLSSTGFYCQTGDCASGTNGQCSNTAYEPFTRVEEIFGSTTTQGNYDIALEDGPTVPTEFKGLGPVTDQVHSPAASFVCAGAGAPIPIPYPNPPYDGVPLPDDGSTNIALGACPWTYTLPDSPSGSSALYNFVTYNGTINSCSDCASPGVCGLAYITTSEAKNIALSCGKLLGYWSFTSLGTVTYVGNPAYNPSLVFEFDKQLTVANGFQANYPANANAYDLYSCTPQGSTLTSCYTYPSIASSYCCGGQNWNTAGSYGSYLTSQASNMSAVAANPDWISAGTLPISPYDSIVWMKLACPTGYSYPFDDQSVSFNCNYSDAAQSVAVPMDFEVVFCPGGIVGDLSTDP